MKIKSFFAGSVEGAVDMARHELGPEAMILNSRKAPAEAKHLGQYEVVFALNPPVELPRGEMPCRDAVIPPNEDVTPRRLLSLAQPPQDVFTREILEFRKQMERMLKAVARSGVVGSKWTA